MLIDQNFKNWIEGLSNNYQQAQRKTMLAVTKELNNSLYTLGRKISRFSKLKEDIIPEVSKELIKITDKKIMFSETNLRFCVSFYKLYKDATKEEFELIEMIPWSTHITILDSCKSKNDAIKKIKSILGAN